MGMSQGSGFGRGFSHGFRKGEEGERNEALQGTRTWFTIP